MDTDSSELGSVSTGGGGNNTNKKEVTDASTESAPIVPQEITDEEFNSTIGCFREELTSLCDCILNAAISYVDARLCIQTTTRMKEIFDNNRPHWREDPRVQGLLQAIDNLESMEGQLQTTKDFIRSQKDLLIRAYDKLQQTYARQEPREEDGLTFTSDQRDKLLEVMTDMNVKIVHAMTAMELVLAADNRTSGQIDEAVFQHIAGDNDHDGLLAILS